MPPVADTVIDAEPPLQAILPAPDETTNTVGCVTTDVQVAEHPLASVTVTVYVPAGLPLIEDVIADVLHK